MDPGPVGTDEIIIRTSVLNEDEASRLINHDLYFESGYKQITKWLEVLEKYQFCLRTAQAIFELGCGSARLIRHMRNIEGIRLVASDTQAEFVEWCRKNLSGIEFYCNDFRPPLSFADDDSFDLVIAQSVFTHIPLETQSDWIREIRRILRPDGYAILNVLGRNHQKSMLSSNELDKLRENGNFTLDSTDDNASFSTKMIGSYDFFQTRQEILKAFGAELSVIDYLPGFLDLLILKKSR